MAAAYFHQGLLIWSIFALCVGASSASVAMESSGDCPDPSVEVSPPEQGEIELEAVGLMLLQTAAFLEAAPVAGKPNAWPTSLQVIAGSLTVLLVCLGLKLLQSAGDQACSRSAAQPRKQLAPSAAVHVFLALAAACAMAIDGTVSSLVVSILPELCGGSGAPLLVFAKPMVAIVTATVLLPAWIPGGSAWGHFVTGIGLLLLAASCLIFATAESTAWALMGQLINAVASPTIFVSVLHTRLQEARSGKVGLHLAPVLAGSAVGYACAPWIGTTLQDLFGIPAMFIALACTATFICFLHVAVYRHTVDSSTAMDAMANKDEEIHSNMPSPTFSVLNQKRLMLLWGIVLGTAVLSVHSMAVPLYLQSLAELDGDRLAAWQGVANMVLVFAMLVGSVLFDHLSASAVTGGMITALVLCILGLRSMASYSARHMVIATGLVGSLAGLGLYLGLAVPLFGALGSGATGTTRKQYTGIVDATPSGLLVGFWFFGDAVGVGAQLLLGPFMGVRLTILAFACGLALHATAVLSASGWWLKAKRPKEVDNDVQKWLEANEQHLPTSLRHAA